MNWYVKGIKEFFGPMSKEEALCKAEQADGIVFSEQIFSPKIAISEEAEQVIEALRTLHYLGGCVRSISQRAIDMITLLSREEDEDKDKEEEELCVAKAVADSVKSAFLQLHSSDPLNESDRRNISALLTHLLRPRIVTGTIHGGVLDLDKVPHDVKVDIRDYDTDGMDEDNLEEDETGRYVKMLWAGSSF